VYTHLVHKLMETLAFPSDKTWFAALDSLQDLRTLDSSVFHKRNDVLVQALHGIFHFRVESLCSLETGDKVIEVGIHLAVLGHDGHARLVERLVFALFRADTLVLQESIVRSSELL
jgi:hypothetical protein